MIRPRRPGRRHLVPVVAAFVALTVGVDCGGPPPRTAEGAPSTPGDHPSGSPTAGAPSGSATGALAGGGLLLLAGRPGAMSLEWIGDEGRTPAGLPDPDVAWISTDRAGRVLATTRDGRAFLSDAISPDRTATWRRLVPAGLDPSALAGPLAFGTLAADGSRAAFIAADFSAGESLDVVIVDTADSAATDHRIPHPADGAPPVWTGRRLVVLTRERGDVAGATILDPDTDRLTEGPGPPAPGPAQSPRPGWSGPIAALSVAADGSRLAVGTSGDGRIEIHPAGPWLAGDTTRSARVVLVPLADGSRAFAWLALGWTGDRLAVVRTDTGGDSVALSTHAADDDWREGLRIALPAGAVRAVVAWLP